MLVAISDLHITDERTAINVPQGAFDILEREIIVNVLGRGREIHLVLLGDIFDLVRTDYWHRKCEERHAARGEASWNGKLSPSTGMNPDPGVEQQTRDIWRTSFEGRRPVRCWR